jgi:hypothetical protein
MGKLVGVWPEHPAQQIIRPFKIASMDLQMDDSRRNRQNMDAL